jgi:membrane protein YqaA with SNARE-associated domain
MDIAIVVIGVTAPERAYLSALLAVLGSVAGNLILYYLARRGGKRWAEAHTADMKPGKQQRFQAWFERYGLLTVFVPAVVVIPLPLKIFVISAGVLRTPVWHFLGTILLARIIRYFGLAYLGVSLGKDAQAFLTRNAWNMVGIAVALFAVLYLAVRMTDRRRFSAPRP